MYIYIGIWYSYCKFVVYYFFFYLGIWFVSLCKYFVYKFIVYVYLCRENKINVDINDGYVKFIYM